jgi:hypothetical protein
LSLLLPRQKKEPFDEASCANLAGQNQRSFYRSECIP